MKERIISAHRLLDDDQSFAMQEVKGVEELTVLMHLRSGLCSTFVLLLHRGTS
jgi:hypothetical protein